MQFQQTLDQIIAQIEGVAVTGSTGEVITGIATLSSAQAGDLSFLGNKKYKNEVPQCKASVVLVPNDFVGEPSEGQVYLRVENPSLELAKLCSRIEHSLWPKPEAGIHPSAVVAASAKVHEDCHIAASVVIEEGAELAQGCVVQAGVHIGRNVKVGKGCWLMPKAVVMDYCELGERVRLQPGCVIGSDGFGYETIEGAHQKIPQVGIVVLGDDVELGANTTIDRARFGKTLIGAGTKIDNLVQIGHNVVTGQHCIIVSQAGISGSTELEDYVVLAGQVGLAGHLKIGSGVQVGAQSGINSNIEAGAVVRGTPAYPFMLAHKIDILKKRLPELFKRVAKVEELLEHLEQPTSE